MTIKSGRPAIKIPIYESKMSLQPTPVDPSKAALLGKEVVDVSKGLEGMALQIKEHQDWNETNKAELALSNSYDDNLTMVHSDEDIGTLKERLNRKNLSDLDSAAKLINSPDARNEFLAKAQLKQSMQNAHLDAVIHSRQIDEGKTTFLANSESNEKHFVHAANPDERELYRQEIIKNANYAASMGYISKAHAQRYLENIMPHLDIQTVSYDISINPQRALEELKKGDKGLYSNLDESKRLSMEKMAQTAIDKNEKVSQKQFKDTQIKNEFNALDKMVTTKIKPSISDVQDMVASGQINSRVGEAWTRYLQSPKAVDARSDSKLKAFSTVADGIFRSWDKVGVRESMTQMLKEAESGHISDDELFLLVKAADMRQKALTTTDGGKNWLQKTGDNLNKINPFHNDSNHSEVQKGYDAVVAHAEDSDEDKGTGVKTYLKEVAKGTDPKSAKDIAIKDVDGIPRFFPDYKSYPVKGKPKLIGNKVYRIFPDATWKEDK